MTKKQRVAMTIFAAIIVVAAGISVWSVSGTQEHRISRFQDLDQDGLTDEAEQLYLTDPTNPDTDGDGTNDGDEVAAGRNPLQAQNDELKPATGKEISSTSSYTNQYLATLPEDTPREEIIDQTKLEAFVARNRPQLVPDMSHVELTIIEPTNTETVAEYLASISSESNPDIIAVSNQDIEAAWRLSYVNFEPETLQKIVFVLERNIEIYQGIAVPSELGETHRRLIALHQALLANTQLLQNMQQDFVGGLVAAQNLHDLAPQFQALAANIQAIRAQYTIE